MIHGSQGARHIGGASAGSRIVDRAGKWKFVTEESKLDLFPKDPTWQSSLPTPGFAVPGTTKLS